LLARQARTKTLKLHHEAQHLFLGHGREWGVYEKGWDAEKVTKLRRGIDIETFKPTLGDPDWLRQRFGIPKHRRIILFAGRVDRTKNAPLAAEAVAYALQQGHTDIHFLALGKGAEMETIKNLLGDHATLPGPADQSTLATAMASSDLFLFPSVTEVVGNVVQEAIVCGLPVMSHRWDNSVQFHQPDLGQGLLVDSKKPEVWGAHLVELLSDPDRLPNMAEAAKRWSRENAQSWDTVFERQLLPIWMGER